MTRNTTLQYVRTPLGRAAAFSPDAKLPISLKAMLKAVDGKTSVSALVVQFAGENAADFLAQLEFAGLIKLREERATDFQASGLMPALPDSSGVAELAGFGPLQPMQGLPTEPPTTGLSRIVDVMATFVLTHLPQQAFTLLAKFEGFQTLDQLKAELPDYAVLASASGPAGVVHLADVTERVREAAAA